MQGYAIVKSVLSGDTVLLMGSVAGVAPEMQLSLAYCQAPRVARTAEGVEEYFGWESREYLRKMVIGQVVKFKVLYKVDAISRTFGTIELKDKDVLRDMVSSGYVSVRSERDEKGNRELYEELLELQTAARDNHRGIWNPTKALRHVSWTLDDPESFFQANKGMPMAAVVEQVRDGSTLKLYLLETGEMISLRLAGLQAPRIAYAADGKATYDAFAAESRCFSELRVLNRSIVIIIDGMDKFNNFFGRVEHPSGSLAKELLSAGLARVVDWSLNFLPVEDVSVLREAELKAKKEHLRLWKDWAVNTTYAAIQGQVLQVMSGDTMVLLLDGKDPLVPSSQRRVNLASVRAPKLGNPKKNIADEPWAQEAKERLVHLAIGKKVKVAVEYERTSLVGTEEQTFTHCSVELMNGMNLAEELVRAGLVSVVRHRDDEDRAANYDQLLLAENQAKQAKVGLFSPKKPSIRRRVDFSETPAKAKTNLHFLKQKPRYNGHIEHVFTACHYLVSIPEENCQFSFSLQGVKAPLPSSRGKAESFGDESLMYAKLHYLQRDVTIEIVNVDKGGSFIGDMYLGSKKESMVLELLREGAVYINDASIDFCRAADRMEEIEEKAKKDRKGYWKDYVEAKKPTELVVSGEMDLTITSVMSGDVFYAIAETDREMLRTVENALKTIPIPNNQAVVAPVKGGVYACLIGSDSQRHWERVRLISSKGGSWSVYCVDTGVTLTVSSNQLHDLSESIQQVPALARACCLAGIEAPRTGEWGKMSRECLDDLADTEFYHARVVLRDNENRLVLFLYREDDPEISLNEMMLAEGWARIQKNAGVRLASYASILQSMRKFEADAKEDRVGIYIHGDIGFETDE